MTDKAESRKRSIAQKKAKAKQPIPPATAKAFTVNAKIRSTGVLPKPRIEVRESPNGFGFRKIAEDGRKGDWSERFTLRNNCRRAARKAYPGVPVVSQ